jgi:L-ascorbate metabolism protein UlaG (beta-lactamase superfamily)
MLITPFYENFLRLGIAGLNAIRPSKSEVVLTLLNKYSCIYVATQTQRLLFNPSEINIGGIEPVDYTLITDEQPEHFDENLITELCVLKKSGKIIADETSYRILRSQIPKEMLVAAKPNKLLVSNGLIIKSYPSENPEASTPVTYMVTLENGCKIFQTGASPVSKALKRITMEEKPDITFIPVGFSPMLNAASWVESAENSNSKIVIPYHGEDLSLFPRVVKRKGLKIGVVILKVGEPFTYRVGQ